MKDFKIAGLRLPYFLVALVILVISLVLKVFPLGMVGAFLFLMLIGELINIIGNKLPIVSTYLGGGALVSVFIGAAIAYYKVLPEESLESINTFMTKGGFLDFYIAALITGSILGMNRKLLIKAAIKYIPCILGSVIFALLFVSIAGFFFHQSVGESIAYIGIPIMGGGMGAGAVPIAKVFEQALGIPYEQILSRLVSAVALGNAFAIIFGGVLNRIGKIKPSLTGNGMLVRSGDEALKSEKKGDIILKGVKDYSAGIIMACGFFTFGVILSHLFGLVGIKIHSYAWMIISVVIVKILGVVPENLEYIAEGWFDFIAKNFTAALMLGLGTAYTDLGQIIAAISFSYVVLVLAVVIGAIIGAGLVGYFVGFYPIESAITAGLCMANMGGTGDVAVLTAAERMELMPFAQISSRLGGALIILLAGILVPIFF